MTRRESMVAEISGLLGRERAGRVDDLACELTVAPDTVVKAAVDAFMKLSPEAQVATVEAVLGI